jgi:hypothetical protein
MSPVRIPITFVIVVALVSLSGCSTTRVAREETPQPSTGKGLLIFSWTVNDNLDNAVLSYRGIGSATHGEVLFTSPDDPFDWTAPLGRLVVLELPAGKYEMFKLTVPGTSQSDESFAIPFTVSTGRAVYAGNVQLAFDARARQYRVETLNSARRDLALLGRRYPDIGPSQITVALSKVIYR